MRSINNNVIYPGPKMIWQFGEQGYDISIDYPCEFVINLFSGIIFKKIVKKDYLMYIKLLQILEKSRCIYR